MVAIGLLAPGCRGTAPEPGAWFRLCPSFHQAPELFLVCVLEPGCARNPAGTVPWITSPAALSSRDIPPQLTGLWSCFWFVLVPLMRLNVGEMNISTRKNYENPVPALVRHRRKKGLAVGFCQCMFFYFSYFNKCLFREEERSGNSNNHCRYEPILKWWQFHCTSGLWNFLWLWCCALKSLFSKIIVKYFLLFEWT